MSFLVSLCFNHRDVAIPTRITIAAIAKESPSKVRADTWEMGEGQEKHKVGFGAISKQWTRLASMKQLPPVHWEQLGVSVFLSGQVAKNP